MSLAYYNENDPFCANWLRNLIDAGHIAPGIVDERSIEDVRPGDLDGFTQHHFFAGIGGWSYALRLAGWPDHVPVWTGSCPCQPFSAAGKGNGFDDERHLWPLWYWLIKERGPSVIFGEQVASKSAEPWFDLVQADVEALDFAFGLVAYPAAGVGAPHLRDRAYWVAHTAEIGWPGIGGSRQAGASECSEVGGMADADSGEQPREPIVRGAEPNGEDTGRSESGCKPEPSGDICGLAHADPDRLKAWREASKAARHGDSPDANGWFDGDESAHPTNGVWRDSDWLLCRDGKFRPVESGTFPLAHGVSARVGQLRGYGNAIVAEQGAGFVRAFMDHMARERAEDELVDLVVGIN